MCDTITTLTLITCINVQCLSSADPRERKAGCAVLGIISEGCKDALTVVLSSIVAGILPVTQDRDLTTRECAWFALGNIFDCL